MIQNIVKVKSTTTLQGKKGPYLSVVWTDGDKEFKKNVFEPAHQKVFQQAEKSGESVKVGVEKEGDFFNVKSAEITTGEPQAHAERAPISAGRAYPPKDTDAIMLQVAFKGAIECETHHTVPEGNLDKSVPRVISATDGLFVGLQEIIKRRCGNPLVEAIKKEGGVEV